MASQDGSGASSAAAGGQPQSWEAPQLHLNDVSTSDSGVKVQIDTLGTIDTIDGGSNMPYSTE